MDTHAGVVLKLQQQLLCRQQEVEEVAEAVSAVRAVHHTEDLTEERGGGALEGGVEGRQSGLDAAV